MLLLLIIFLVYADGEDDKIFCASPCSDNDCDGGALNECDSCSDTFMQGNTGDSFPCITQTVNLTSTSGKYMPVGTSPDINYDLKSNTTVSNMTVTSTASPLTG